MESEKQFRAILYLDDFSRLKIKTNVFEMGLQGISFINNFSELTEDLINDTKVLIVLDGYMDKNNSVSDLILYKTLFDLDVYCMGAVKRFTGVLDGIAKVFECDISLLDFDMIQSAVYGEISGGENDFTQGGSGVDTPDGTGITVRNQSLAKRILNDTINYDVQMQNLATEYLSLSGTIRHLVSQRDELKKSLNNSEVLLSKLTKENDKLVSGYADSISKTLELNKSLKVYESILTKDIYEKIDLSKYNRRPLIIYFKEIEDFVFLNTFIKTLYYVFMNQYHKSVKVVRLYDSVKIRKLSTLPDDYHRLYNEFRAIDVIENNFLCKTGDYRDLLDILLTNNSGLDVLLLFDHKDLMDRVLSGSYLQFNLCRGGNQKILDSYGIRKENTIVNQSPDDNNLVWNYYEGVEDLQGEQKWLFLSSRPVITKIYRASKLFAETV